MNDNLSRPGFCVGIAIFLLNLYDAFISLSAIAAGIAVEVNPIAHSIMSHSDDLFVIVKASLGISFAVLSSLYWEKCKIVRYGGFFLLSVYTSLAIYLTHGWIIIHNP